MKNYILDTTVLLHDAGALFNFGENHVIIPIPVIEDIDHFKKDLSEIGRSARQTSRILDMLRQRASVSSGIPLEGGGMLSIKMSTGTALRRLPEELRNRSRGNMVLAVALEAKEQAGDVPTIFVSKDINLRIKADALGLTVEDYESDAVSIEELYTGFRELDCTDEQLQRYRASGRFSTDVPLLPHEYVVLRGASETTAAAYGRFDQHLGAVVGLLAEEREGAWRIAPRNREQLFAMDALLDDSIQLVTLVGKAGTGKTLLAVAASLYKTVDENVYSRILVSRPTLPMGKDIGYLPGTVEEKLTPWMYPIADNVELIMRQGNRANRTIRGFRELVDMGILVIEPLTYIRGRSIHNQYLIIDEAQNLTPHEIKTIITRVGEGTKIVVTGDPYQIDNPYIDSSSNGLTYVVERLKKQDITAHVVLTKGERSRLSELAANLL
ncbi:MAG: PhoH family protein [Chitinispirillaceae bacterium]|nr:PhoH family protein [Chitinispirillaceae bacterium]